jgi:hypothetical protein
MVNRHLKRRCEAVSCVWLQILQLPQLGHPLFSSLSAIQTLFWMTNQAKSLHFGGAHNFQTKDGMEELACPQKNYFVSGIRRVTPIIRKLPRNCI